MGVLFYFTFFGEIKLKIQILSVLTYRSVVKQKKCQPDIVQFV